MSESNYKVGQIITGEVNNIRDDGIFINIDKKSYGFLPNNQIPTGKKSGIKKWDKVDAKISTITERGILLSMKFDQYNNSIRPMESFIAKLQKQRSDYKYASQAKTQAESLKQLSEGIYTEEERFVYELLQNAVDAYIDSEESALRISIEIQNDTLCFMHNGIPFNQRDIKGLCDVGNSNKSDNKQESNKKKVGYKGIGFKSVFMKSVYSVCVCSGPYTFKFDKNECARLMPKYKGEKLDADDIPWQIIPIECERPSGFDVSGFNVATFITGDRIGSIAPRIRGLLNNPQFLLFLNASNIKMSLNQNGKITATAQRKTQNGEVILYSDGVECSRWLLHTSEPIEVSDEIKKELKRDFNTPQKLKEAKEFEISFAIKIDENENLEPVEDSVIYTFLPTSYTNLGVPFLVNANFITDAGRQQLHQNSAWNRLIFASIPEQFFIWVSDLSQKYEDYWKILPNINAKSSDDLTEIYEENLRDVIDTTPFIPRISGGKLVKVSEALIDDIGICKTSLKGKVISSINRIYNKNFHLYNCIDGEGKDILKSYGVFILSTNQISKILDDDLFVHKIEIDTEVELIRFLYQECETNGNKSLEEQLKRRDFLLDQSHDYQRPDKLFFPSDNFDVDDMRLLSEVNFLHYEIVNALSSKIKSWIGEKGLGVRYFSKANFMKYVLDHPDYVTTDNAIEVGQMIFYTCQKNNFDIEKDDLKKLQSLNFLSSSGGLAPLANLYLGSIFNPEDDIQSVFDDIDFISEDYCEDDNAQLWEYFFKKCGVKQNIGITTRIINENSAEIKKYDFLVKTKENFKVRKHSKTDYCGFKNPMVNINLALHYFSFIDTENPNFDLDRFVLSKVLSKPFNISDEDSITGKISYWGTVLTDPLKDHLPEDFINKYGSFMSYCLASEQLFPTVTHEQLKANEVFLNTEIIRSYGLHYLPILDIDDEVHSSWLQIIPFKKELQLDDYLEILAQISEESDDNVDNSDTISKIYQRLVEVGFANNPKVAQWGKTHKIKATHGKSFFYPSELTYITIDGFGKSKQVYLGKIDKSLKDGVLKLLKNLGVKVITEKSITPIFKGVRLSESFKRTLISNLDYIALLMSPTTEEEFDDSRQKILSELEESEFYHCDEIVLSYGDEDDIIEKKTFSTKNKFYYTGELTPARIEPLLQPLASYLNISTSKDELFVILITKNRNEILDYLDDKGYRVDLLPTEEKIVIKQVKPIIETKNFDAIEEVSNTMDIEIESIPETPVIEKKNTSEIGEKTNAHNEDDFEMYRTEYSQKITDFMGGGFDMPDDRVRCEHVISRYRILMYLKEIYTLHPDFDEKEFMRDGYNKIEIIDKDGKVIKVNPVGANYGLWYISPGVWRDLTEKGNWICLCLGRRDTDFKVLQCKEDLEKVINESPSSLMRIKASKYNYSNMEAVDKIFPGDANYGDGVRLIVMVKQDIPNKEIQYIFDNHVYHSPNDDGYDDV